MKLTKCAIMVAGFWLLALASPPAEAGVRMGLGLNIDLPLLTFQAPPELAVIPGSYVYYVPDSEHEIFFFQGQWYRSWDNRWHRARSYDGPWSTIGPRYVPGALRRLPPYYRQGRGHERMRFQEVDRHWRGWERERHWDKRQDWGRERSAFSRDDREGGHDRHHGRGR